MKIAYLIMVHKDPKQIKRLVDSISSSGDCFIHVDKKTDIIPFEDCLQKSSNVFFMKRRIRVNWAAWSMVQVYMELMDMAFKHANNYDRFVFLTGQDYPLMSNAEIVREFEAHPETEYVMAYKISTSTIPTDKNKILKKWFFENPFTDPFLRRCWYSFTYRFITKFSNRRKLTVPLGGKEVDSYFGQMLSAFTRRGAELLLDVYRHDTHYNTVMKYVHAAVEEYWQTVIFNSELRENTIQNGEEHEVLEHFGFAPLHYHTYIDECSIFEEKDFDILKNCGYMFCRKVIPGFSDSLMDKIDLMRAGK